MNTRGMIKVGACLTALFVFGGVCGFTVATRRLTNPALRAQVEERWLETRRSTDAARLDLTPEQIEAARPGYQQMLADIRAVRASATAGVIEAAMKQGRALWPQLTPAQQQEFLRLDEERRAQRQKRAAP